VTADAIIAAIAQCENITELSEIVGAGIARIATLASSNGNPVEDQLIDVHEAARITGLSESQLYHGEFPFSVKGKGQGRKRLYSRARIQRYIARNAGKQ
jgi:hypothetical protein